MHFDQKRIAGRNGRRLAGGLLLCLFLAGAPVFLHAGPAEDADAQAMAVQRLIDDGRAADGEALARAAVAAAETDIGADALATANLYRLLGDTLFEQRRYDDAEPYFRKALAVRRATLAPNDPEIARSANDLAVSLKSTGAYQEAESLYRQALAIRQTALGPDHPDVAKTWFGLARLFDARGDHADAAGALENAIAIGATAFGSDHRTVISWRGERAFMLHFAGEYDAAEPAYRAAIAAAEATFEESDAHLASYRQGFANLLFETRRADEAEPLYRAALAAREAALGPDHPAVAASLEGLGRALEKQKKPDEAVAAYRRALPIREATAGATATATDALLMRLGVALMGSEQADEAERVFRRLLDLRERVQGPEAAGVGEAARWVANAANAGDRSAEAEIFAKRALSISLATREADDLLTGFDFLVLGLLYSGQQRFAEADPLLTRALSIMETHGQQSEEMILARTALAYTRFSQRRVDEAATLTQRSLDAVTAARGAKDPTAAELMLTLAYIRLEQKAPAAAERLTTAARAIYRDIPTRQRSLIRADSLLGRIRMAEGRFDEAGEKFAAALAWLRGRFGADSAETIPTLADLGEADFMRGDFAAARIALERATALTERLAAINAQNAIANRTGTIEDQAIARGAIFDHLIKTYARLSQERPRDRHIYAEKAFLVAQRVIDSRAAVALSQLGARHAAGNGELAGLVRERQDLVEQWQRDDRRLTALHAQDPSGNSPARIATIETALSKTDRRIRAIDAQLAEAFPDFATLRQPAPSGFTTARAALAEDEILLFYADTSPLGTVDFETYLWAVPKRGTPRWIRLDRPSGALAADVRLLRGMLGVGPQARGAQSLVAADEPDREGAVLAIAAGLYQAMLAPVAEMIAGKKLVIVPSRSLASLPFHLLVSTAPEAGRAARYHEAGWLLRDHPITVLPSVSSLAALAAVAHSGEGRVPYLGFANPLLTGPGDDDRRAFARTDCGPAAAGGPKVARASMPTLSSLFRGAAADVGAVRRLAPLPETTDEACAIARALQAGDDAVYLGRAASEAGVKRVSEEGRLARARIVHFATHGLVSGDLSGLAEPAIVLTPPATATARDDGLLTASEVATLKLDADWVILSACNTASGDGGGEALSGLARAFFYAGARALLVSHWPVQSDAAVRLVTGAVAAMVADPRVDRAEALRRAMLAEIEAGGTRADPASWAPFILVGSAH